MKVLCPYCGKEAVLLSGADIYPKMERLRERSYWRCESCDAHVGCRPGTVQPMGSLATKSLRSARMAAHRAFDPVWKMYGKSRTEAYTWLAEKLGIPIEKCHIGQFDEILCAATVYECRRFRRIDGNSE